jgi:hypothetical protein
VRRAAVALGAPGLVLSCAIVAAAMTSVAGLAPPAHEYQLTLAEAAALHDIAEIVRLVRQGHDPRQPAVVRAGILRDRPMTLTPMAAAILARRVDAIDVLAAKGGGIRGDEFPQYWCLAQSRGDAAVIAAVETQVPLAAPVDCSTVQKDAASSP